MLTFGLPVTFRIDIGGLMGLSILRHRFRGAFPKTLLQEAHHLEVSGEGKYGARFGYPLASLLIGWFAS